MLKLRLEAKATIRGLRSGIMSALVLLMALVPPAVVAQGKMDGEGSIQESVHLAPSQTLTESEDGQDVSIIAPQFSELAKEASKFLDAKRSEDIGLRDGGDGACFLGVQSSQGAVYTAFQVQGSDFTVPMGISTNYSYIVGSYVDSNQKLRPFRVRRNSSTGSIYDVRSLPLTGFDQGAALGISNEGAVSVGTACKNSDGAERCAPEIAGIPNPTYAPKAVRWDGASRISVVPRPTQFITTGQTSHPLYASKVPSASEFTIGEASEVSNNAEEIAGSYGWIAVTPNSGVPAQSFAFRWKKPTPTPTRTVWPTLSATINPSLAQLAKGLSYSDIAPTPLASPTPAPLYGDGHVLDQIATSDPLQRGAELEYIDCISSYEYLRETRDNYDMGPYPLPYRTPFPYEACRTPTPIPTGASFAIPVPLESEGGPPSAQCSDGGACQMPAQLGCCNYSNGYALSADGETVVGTFAINRLQGQNRRRAFKWRGGEARMRALPPIDRGFSLTPTVTPRGVAHGISPDGVVIVGEDSKGETQTGVAALQPAVPYPTWNPYRYHEAFGFSGTPGPGGNGVTSGLGDLPDTLPNPSNPQGEFKDGRARDASNYSYKVVGSSYDAAPDQTEGDDERPLRTAFLWENSSMAPIKDVLLNNYGLDIDAANTGGMQWHLVEATAITPSGNLIVGWATCIPQPFASYVRYGFVIELRD